MSVKSRKAKIKQAIKTANVTQIDKSSGHPSRIIIHGSDFPATRYHVNIKAWDKCNFAGLDYFLIKTTCINPDGWQDCEGNSNGHICYHTLAAMHKRINWQGKKFVACDSFQAAVNLSNFGGILVKLVSSQGKGVVWGVVK